MTCKPCSPNKQNETYNTTRFVDDSVYPNKDTNESSNDII